MGKNGDTGDGDKGDAGVPKFVSRIAQFAGNPPVLKALAQPTKPKPDSNGTSPAMTEGGMKAWRDGTPHGRGSYTGVNGGVYQGHWNNGCYRASNGRWAVVNASAANCGFE